MPGALPPPARPGRPAGRAAAPGARPGPRDVPWSRAAPGATDQHPVLREHLNCHLGQRRHVQRPRRARPRHHDLVQQRLEHRQDVLEPLLDEIVVTRSSSARALDVSTLAEVAVEVFGEDRVYVAERLDEALTRAVDLAESAVLGSPTGAGVLVTGSITVVAEARVLIGRARRGS